MRGRQLRHPDSDACIECEAGKFSPARRAHRSLVWQSPTRRRQRADKFASPGNVAYDACEARTYSPIGGRDCPTCNLDTHALTDIASCTPCEAGNHATRLMMQAPNARLARSPARRAHRSLARQSPKRRQTMRWQIGVSRERRIQRWRGSVLFANRQRGLSDAQLGHPGEDRQCELHPIARLATMAPGR